MSDKPPAPDTTPDVSSHLHWLREEERHEISWIDHRLQWMLLSQSFLMTAAIMAQSKDYPWWCGTVITFILGCLGAWLALRGGLAIRAAQAVSQAWLRREQELCATNKAALKPYRLSRPMHRGEPLTADHLHCVAVKLHERIHPVFIAAWILLFFAACAVGLANDSSSASTFPVTLQFSRGTVFLASALFVFVAAVLIFYFVMRADFRNLKQAAKDLEQSNNPPAEVSSVQSPSNENAPRA